MNAVERILHYINSVPQEITPEGYPVPSDDWPQEGALVRYQI